MTKDSYWVFGIDYLEQCSIEGNSSVELFISRIRIRNEKHALKIINLARSKGLIEVGEWQKNIHFSLW